MRDTDLVIDVMKKLNHDDERIVQHNVIYLGYLRSRASKAREILISFLNHSSANLRRWTVRTLAQIGIEDTLEYLVNCQNDSDEMVRKTAEWAVKYFPSCATELVNDCSRDDIDLLVQTMENGTDDQKIHATFAMGILDWPRMRLAFPHLLKALKDPSPDVRRKTLETFVEFELITNPKSYFFAIRDCVVDDDLSVRDTAASRMGDFLTGWGRDAYDGIIKPELIQNDESETHSWDELYRVGSAFHESGGDSELIRKAMIMLHDIMMTNAEQS